MTRELFKDWSEYFVKRMTRSGYGRKHGKPMILVLDGHTSRWTHQVLKTLIEGGFFPFCIGSHTSAWAQPNDCGVNASFKATLGRMIHRWRVANPLSVFDRVTYNRCLVKTVNLMDIKLAGDLASWKARKVTWESTDMSDPLIGKPDNVVTRSFTRTVW